MRKKGSRTSSGSDQDPSVTLYRHSIWPLTVIGERISMGQKRRVLDLSHIAGTQSQDFPNLRDVRKLRRGQRCNSLRVVTGGGGNDISLVRRLVVN